MGLKWRFAMSNYNTKRGINDAGIVSFTGNRIKSLIREIIQNSLDAKNNDLDEKPVIIEFNEFSLSKNDIPDVENLENALRHSLVEVDKLKDKRPKLFFENSIDVINRKKIPFLRISDFNTEGLTGVESTSSSSWYNLVRSQGISDKAVTDGGSFGIGKNAAFACSDLRTVIYSTKTFKGEVGTQGVSHLISFYPHGEDKDFTQGTGYLGLSKRSSPLLELISLDKSFKRETPGTDIFIAGLYEQNITDDAIVTTLNNFLYAIYKNTLEIKVNNRELNNKTLKMFVDQYRDEIDLTTLELYKLLTDKNAKIYKEAIYGTNDDVEIRLLVDESGSRKVSMIRNPWMKIKEVDGFPRRFKFMGVVIIKGNRLNTLLRKTENPLHDDWEPERIKSEPEQYRNVKKLLIKINRIIRSKLDGLYEVDLSSYLDIFGAEDYIPLKTEVGKGNVQKKVQDLVRKINIRQTDHSPVGKNILEMNHGDIELDIDGVEDIITQEDPIPHKPDSKTKREEFEEIIKNRGRKVKIQRENVRILAIDRQNGLYRMIIKMDSNIKAHLKLDVLDEQGDVIKDFLIVEKAELESINIEVLDNYIKDVSLKPDINYLDIKINTTQYVSLGVEIYEI